MTEEELYAAAQREAVRPFECSLSPECWVTHGGRATLNPMSLSKTPRCLACDGKLQLAFWKTPKDLKLAAARPVPDQIPLAGANRAVRVRTRGGTGGVWG